MYSTLAVSTWYHGADAAYSWCWRSRWSDLKVHWYGGQEQNRLISSLLSSLTFGVSCSLLSPQSEAVIVSALDIIRYTFRIRSCSAFARHLSCLLCRIILVPSNVSPAASAGLFLFHQASLYVFSSVLQSLLILHAFLYPLYHKSLFTPWCLHVFMLISVKKCLIQVIFG